ncbi:MAG: hypothetical protein JXA77_09230 [Bacteroidales bacterium]|nr:hypothetical protein [Bacteroidales bacterium]MBN2819625.1 hypothetical protein [Bacteroidales bacterium]
MRSVIGFNIATIVLSSVVIVVLVITALHNKKRTLPFVFLIVAMCFMIFVNLTNILEHTGISTYFEIFEDFLKMLIIPFLVFAVYGFWLQDELKQRKETEDFLDKVIKTAPVITYIGTRVRVVYGKCIPFIVKQSAWKSA